MKLHQEYFLKSAARNLAPLISNLIISLHLTTTVRKLIAFLNYCLGKGAGMGWRLEDEVNIAIKNIFVSDPVVLDVGGNIGDWSQIFRKKFAGGKLYIFEPQLGCQRIIKSKNIPKSELICAAVGSERGKMTLYSSSDMDGSASLHERKDSFFNDRVYRQMVVEIITLDEWAESLSLKYIDFIKFDIEGHEFFALQGMRKLLQSKKVGAFTFEFGGGNLNSRTIFRDFWDILSENYSIFIITPSGKTDLIIEYYEDLEYYRGVSNFLAKLK